MSACPCARPPVSVPLQELSDAAQLPVMGFTQGLCTRNQAGHYSCAVPVNDFACAPTGRGDFDCGVWTTRNDRPAYAGAAACQRLSDTLLSCLVPPHACSSGSCAFGAPPGR